MKIRPANKRKLREPCIHQLKRTVLQENKRERFQDKRAYRKLWHDRELFRPWHVYSIYLKTKRLEATSNHNFMRIHNL